MLLNKRAHSLGHHYAIPSFAMVGLVIVMRFKRLHYVEIILLILIKLLPIIVLIDQLDELHYEGLLSELVEILLHLLIWMGISAELVVVLLQSFYHRSCADEIGSVGGGAFDEIDASPPRPAFDYLGQGLEIVGFGNLNHNWHSYS